MYYEDRSLRHQRLLQLFDPSHGRGLEIGPLFDPVVRKSDGDVQYVDVHEVEKLREYYADHDGVPVEAIVEPDFVIIGPDGARSLPEAVSETAAFSWVVASHVIEHVPDVIGWLGEVATVLVDGGRLVLVVPDRRCCFDALRTPTTVGEMLLAHHQRDTRPSVRAVYDHFSRAVKIDSADAWAGRQPSHDDRIHTHDYVIGELRRSMESDEYIDCHVWLFTPQDFLDQITELASLDLIDFVVESIEPTPEAELEFYVVLRRIPRSAGAEERARQRTESVTTVDDRFGLATEEPREPAQQPHLTRMPVSAKEARLIERKRAVLKVVRSTAWRVRKALRRSA
jgi:SAM-dependent methyltransferase